MKTNNKNYFDFIIIGAGPAGLITGIELVKQNYRVLIVEKQKMFTRTICGEYLTPEGYELFNSLNYPIKLNNYQKLFGMKIFSPQGKYISATFPNNRFGVSLNREQFNRDLSNHFEALGGKINFNDSIEAVENLVDAVKIKTVNGNFICRVLIGADGRQSKTAKLMGLPVQHKRSNRVAIHCYLKPKIKMERFGQMHILADGSYLGINPINDNEVNFSIVADAKKMNQYNTPKEYLNMWIKHSSALSEQFNLIVDEEVKIIATINCEMGKIITRNFALIGDASGFIDPLTGEGITSAIKTAISIASAFKRSSISPTKALLDYQIGRKMNYKSKESINNALQLVIQRPLLCEFIALLLNSSEKLKSVFIGVIGNIYSPKQALKLLVNTN